MSNNYVAPLGPSPPDHQVVYSLRADLTWSVVTCLLDCMLAVKVTALASARHAVLCWVIPLQNLAVAWCILHQPGAYSRHRTGILAVPKLLRMVTVGVTLREYMGHAAAALPELPEGWLGVMAFVVEKGALQLLIGSLGRRLPLRTHVVVQATALLLVLGTNAAHCLHECAHPSTAALYRGLGGVLNASLLRALPVNVASHNDAPPDHPCIIITSWLQLLLGFVAPTLYIDWAEERQKRVSTEAGGPPPGEEWLAPQPVRAALVHVAMMAVALPVAWRVVVAADWWLHLLWTW